MAKIYEKKILIIEEYMDMHQHVNNMVFLQLMQDIASEYSQSIGHTKEMYKELGTTWFIKKNVITYNKPAYLGEEILIKTWVKSAEKTSLIRIYNFINKKENNIICEAETTWVYININTGRPSRIPKHILDDFIDSL